MQKTFTINMMKIAYINGFCDGSTGQIASLLSKEANKQGIETRCFYGRNRNKDSDWIFIGTNKFVTKLNNLFVYLTGKVGHFHKRNSRRLVRELKKFNPDIIHIHNVHNNYLNFPIFFEYLSTFKGKVIITLHDQFLFSGHCGCIPSLCNKYQNGCGNCEYKHIYQKVLRDRTKELLREKQNYLSYINDLTLVSPSSWLNEFVNHSYLSTRKHIVINNGISFGNRLIEKSKSNKIRLLFVSSIWADYKGPKFINELNHLIDHNKYELIVVGNIEKHGVHFEKGINYLGSKTNEEIEKIMCNSDIFITPTLFDTFPTVLLESLSCGLPIIAFKTGGCLEIVSEDVGVFAKEKSASSLLEAIEGFDFSKYTKENCINRSKLYSVEKMSNKYIDLYLGK